MMKRDHPFWFRSVIFATDFSVGSHVAGRYAALLAKRYDAELVVAHAFTLQQAAIEAETMGHVRSTQREHAERCLAEAARELAPSPRKLETVLREGNLLDVIRRVAGERECSLIVLSTHGTGAFERHFIGSVTEEVLRTLQGPVLTVGPHVAVPSGDDLAFRQLLYATDFSPAATQASLYAFALAETFGSEIDMMHVFSYGFSGKQQPADKEKEFLGALERLVPEEAKQLCQPRKYVEFGPVRERVLEHAHKQKTDLIVLGMHHHSRLARHLRTGPAFQVIVEATCPVVTICVP